MVDDPALRPPGDASPKPDTSPQLTHVDESGAARMVDVSEKPVTRRTAVAGGFISMAQATVDAIVAGDTPKGDVLAAARIAGIMAAKRTSDLVPMCHPLSVTHASVELEPCRGAGGGIEILATVTTDGKTGVEMEALTAVAVAGLTLYDMCKAIDQNMVLTDIKVLSKKGGVKGMSFGYITSINNSDRKGVRKTPVASATLVAGQGLASDAHAGDWHRQVSLLATESIDKMIAAGLDVGPGDFAENITTTGIDLLGVPVGTVMRAGDTAVLKVTQIGKECHTRCAIYHQAGDCVMPKEGIFAEVIAGGEIRPGDRIWVEGSPDVLAADSAGAALSSDIP